MKWRSSVFALTVLGCVACSDSVALTGTLEVTTQTRGEQADEDGYELWVDGELEATVGANGATSVELAEGLRIVELEGVADTCTVDGDNPAATSVYRTAPRALTFRVECGPGTLTVSTVTGGDGAPPAALELLVDGEPSGSLAANATRTLTLDPGAHQVGLGSVPETCAVSGSNPRSATVARNATTALTFTLTCSAVSGLQP